MSGIQHNKDQSPPPEGTRVLTVGELTRQVKELVEGNFLSVWVAGEVSGLSRPSSGHVYLKLKDSESVLNAVIYRGIALRMKFDLRDGMEVIVRGRLAIYVPRGEYQMAIEEIQPKGIGALELALRQLKEKLFSRGFFDPKRKRKLPAFPKRVVLVTSPTGAAVRDMLEILGRRWPMTEVWVCPVPVQGEGAGLKIAEAIQRLNRLRGLDILIVGRGGGSMEDLWAFNEESVAQAIFASRIPVVSAVGHETDLTIADLVADCRALTPSEAAERVVPDRGEMLDWLQNMAVQMRTLLRKRVEQGRVRLDNVARRRCFRQPLERLRDLERRLDDWAARLGRSVRQRLVLAQQKLEAAAARLETLSPLNVLRRGYSLTRTETGLAVIRSPEQVRPGDRLITTVQQGRIISRVEEVAPAAPPAALSEPGTVDS
jgi:exodeoxyribonuclease VII large subunit